MTESIPLTESEAAKVAAFGMDKPEPSAHEIVWTFDGDHVTQEAVCSDEDCISRYTCPEPCEVLYDVRREPDGTVTHKPWDDGWPAINRHVMEKTDFCNVADWLNADPWLIPELAETRESFEIARTAIDPVFDDGVTWKRAGVSTNV